MTIETSASIENIAAALGKFQAETHGVVRDATNPFHKNRYATLEAVIETARPVLAKNGLAFLQAPGIIDATKNLTLSTMLMHGGSGEWIVSTMSIPLAKTDPQGVGSAITYGLRYSLMAMLGLPPLDDDAEATKPQPKPQLTQPLQPIASQSKVIYIENSLKRITGFDEASELLAWAKTERQKVWPQYGIDAHDEDGQRLVQAYKERMAVLETTAEVSE